MLTLLYTLMASYAHKECQICTTRKQNCVVQDPLDHPPPYAADCPTDEITISCHAEIPLSSHDEALDALTSPNVADWPADAQPFDVDLPETIYSLDELYYYSSNLLHYGTQLDTKALIELPTTTVTSLVTALATQLLSGVPQVQLVLKESRKSIRVDEDLNKIHYIPSRQSLSEDSSESSEEGEDRTDLEPDPDLVSLVLPKPSSQQPSPMSILKVKSSPFKTQSTSSQTLRRWITLRQSLAKRPSEERVFRAVNAVHHWDTTRARILKEAVEGGVGWMGTVPNLKKERGRDIKRKRAAKASEGV